MYDRLLQAVASEKLTVDNLVAFTITSGQPDRKRPFMEEYTAIKGYFV